jgi:hypothetical protein
MQSKWVNITNTTLDPPLYASKWNSNNNGPFSGSVICLKMIAKNGNFQKRAKVPCLGPPKCCHHTLLMIYSNKRRWNYRLKKNTFGYLFQSYYSNTLVNASATNGQDQHLIKAYPYYKRGKTVLTFNILNMIWNTILPRLFQNPAHVRHPPHIYVIVDQA